MKLSEKTRRLGRYLLGGLYAYTQIWWIIFIVAMFFWLQSGNETNYETVAASTIWWRDFWMIIFFTSLFTRFAFSVAECRVYRERCSSENKKRWILSWMTTSKDWDDRILYPWRDTCIHCGHQESGVGNCRR